MDKHWLRINEYNLLDKRTKIIYPIYNMVYSIDRELMSVAIKNFKKGTLHALNLSVPITDIDNVDLADKSAGLLYDAQN